MAGVQTGARIMLKNILYLTDFSEPSEAALPFAAEVARGFGAKVYAFHVLIPSPYLYATPEGTAMGIEAEEEAALASMQKVDAVLVGLPHETIVERGVSVWQSLERAVKDYSVDLIVLGTHGRTGAQRLLLGSVAEEIFRRSRVPVMTIGPWARKGLHRAARFRRVLFPTDFSAASLAAAPYAMSMAQENQARLLLLHVLPGPEKPAAEKTAEATEAERRLHELVPSEAELWCRPEVLVQHGKPAEQILETAKNQGADLIVLGVRDAGGHTGVAAHLQRTTAHQVVAHALCPVLTVCG